MTKKTRSPLHRMPRRRIGALRFLIQANSKWEAHVLAGGDADAPRPRTILWDDYDEYCDRFNRVVQSAAVERLKNAGEFDAWKARVQERRFRQDQPAAYQTRELRRELAEFKEQVFAAIHESSEGTEEL